MKYLIPVICSVVSLKLIFWLDYEVVQNPNWGNIILLTIDIIVTTEMNILLWNEWI